MIAIFDRLQSIFRTISPTDILDVAVVAYIVYHIIKLVRETRAAQLVKGILAVIVIYAIAEQIHLNTISFIMRNILQVGLISLVVVFQPELRRVLEQVGRVKFSGRQFAFFGANDEEKMARSVRTQSMIQVVSESCAAMSAQKIGALIVIERTTMLGEIVKTGTVVDAQPTPELIRNIFFPNSPLHDGAMIIRDNKVYAAGCFLPLSDNQTISREMGTRHRAALGVSEVSDAVVVVVSEENGTISIANNGEIQRGFNKETLAKELVSRLTGEETDQPGEKKRGLFRRVKR